MVRLPLLSVLAVALTLPSAAYAQVNKCVDPATGKVTYLQSPCPSNTRSEAVRRTVPPAPAVRASAAASKGEPGKAGAPKASGPKTTAELEQEFRKRRQDQEEERKKEAEKLAEAKAKEGNCRNARMQVITLESGVRQARVNEKGERIFL